VTQADSFLVFRFYPGCRVMKLSFSKSDYNCRIVFFEGMSSVRSFEKLPEL
jgi:hypothetical protein